MTDDDPFTANPKQWVRTTDVLWTAQEGAHTFVCELVVDGFGSEARIHVDGWLLISRRFPESWQTLQWAEEERKHLEQGGER